MLPLAAAMAQIRQIIWNLQFGLGRGKLAGDDGVVEAGARMGAVAEGFVGGLAAAAERNHGTAGQPEGGAGRVQNLEVAFDTDGPVAENGDFSGHERDGSTGVWEGNRRLGLDAETRRRGGRRGEEAKGEEKDRNSHIPWVARQGW